MTTVSIEPAIASRWPDVVTALGPGSGPDSCWCQRFRRGEQPSNRAALRQEILEAVTPVGLVAYVGDRPAGWTRVVPRHTLSGIEGNKALRRILEVDERAWWVTCVSIRREHRGIGVGVTLLMAAAEHARLNAASVLDGHPVDVDRLKARPSPSALFTGTVAMFVAAGFYEVGRTYPSRPVMRLTLQ